MNVKEKFPLVYFIVLNYNNASDTIECVHAVEQINYSNFQIVLVDNLSTDDSETILKKIYQSIILSKQIKIWDMPMEITLALIMLFKMGQVTSVF